MVNGSSSLYHGIEDSVFNSCGDMLKNHIVGSRSGEVREALLKHLTAFIEISGPYKEVATDLPQECLGNPSYALTRKMVPSDQGHHSHGRLSMVSSSSSLKG